MSGGGDLHEAKAGDCVHMCMEGLLACAQTIVFTSYTSWSLLSVVVDL
jgi:hypothetical protein